MVSPHHNKAQSTKYFQDATITSSSEIEKLITAAGSAEAVIAYLLKEKRSQKTQNTQLWRLVDKQRAMILGLNTDLERVLKEKERYRSRIKEITSKINKSSSNSSLTSSSFQHSDDHTDSSGIRDQAPGIHRAPVDMMINMGGEEKSEEVGEGLMDEMVERNFLDLKSSDDDEPVSPVEFLLAPYSTTPESETYKDQNLNFLVQTDNQIPSPSNHPVYIYNPDAVQSETESRFSVTDQSNSPPSTHVTEVPVTKKNSKKPLTYSVEAKGQDNLINLSNKTAPLPLLNGTENTGQGNKSEKEINREPHIQKNLDTPVPNVKSQSNVLSPNEDICDDYKSGTWYSPKTEDHEISSRPGLEKKSIASTLSGLPNEQTNSSLSKPQHEALPSGDSSTPLSLPSIESLDKFDASINSQINPAHPCIPPPVKENVPIELNIIPQSHRPSLPPGPRPQKSSAPGTPIMNPQTKTLCTTPISSPTRFSVPSTPDTNYQPRFSGLPTSPRPQKNGVPGALVINSQANSICTAPIPSPTRFSVPSTPDTNYQPRFSGLPTSSRPQKDCVSGIPNIDSQLQASSTAPNTSSIKPSTPVTQIIDSQPHITGSPTNTSLQQGSVLSNTSVYEFHESVKSPTISPMITGSPDELLLSLLSSDETKEQDLALSTSPMSLTMTDGGKYQSGPLNLTSPKPLVIQKKNQDSGDSLQVESMAVVAHNPSILEKNSSDISQGSISDQYPDLLLPPSALENVTVKVISSRMRSSHANMHPKNVEGDSVLTLALVDRSNDRELWQVEKDLMSFIVLDQTLKRDSSYKISFPNKPLSSENSPANFDVQSLALSNYLVKILENRLNTSATLEICKFFSSNVLGAHKIESTLSATSEKINSSVKDSTKKKPLKDGYLMKLGKNLRSWKTRYFILDGPVLRYYESPEGSCVGIIRLMQAQIGKHSSISERKPSIQSNEHELDNKYRHAFLISELKRKDSMTRAHILCAESDLERDRWVDALCNFIGNNLSLQIDDIAHEQNHKQQQSTSINSVSKTIPHTHPSNSSKSNKDISRKKNKDSSSNKSSNKSRKKTTEQAQSPKNKTSQDLVSNTLPVTTENNSLAGLVNENTQSSYSTENSNEGLGTSSKSLSMLSQPTSQVSSSENTLPGQANDLEPIDVMKIPDKKIKHRKRSFFGLGSRPKTQYSDINPDYIKLPNNTTQTISKQPNQFQSAFGAPLDQAVKYNSPSVANVDLPAVVYRCVEYLQAKNALVEEGIFRLSGSNLVIKQLRQRFISEGDVDLVLDDQYYDIHAVASLLKLYLRELPVTVLTKELHVEFLAVTEISTMKEKVSVLKDLVSRLPSVNQALLRYLVSFLSNIISHSDINKMTVRNVGIVFSPTLHIPANVFSLFLQQYEGIFEEEPNSRRVIISESNPVYKKNIKQSPYLPSLGSDDSKKNEESADSTLNKLGPTSKFYRQDISENYLSNKPQKRESTGMFGMNMVGLGQRGSGINKIKNMRQ